MRAHRTVLPVLALAALLAAALPAAASPDAGGLDASVHVAGDGAVSAEAAGAGVDVEPARAQEVGQDVLETTRSPTEAAFSDGGAGDPKMETSGGIFRGSSPTVSEAAGAASVVALAAVALSKLEGAAWLRRVAGLTAVPLYSRIERSDLLDNETRRAIYELVREEAGISMQQVADETGCGWGTVVYHLEKLEDADFVVSERTGGRRRFFAAGEVDPGDKDAVGVLRQETPRRIVAFLLQEPGANQSAVCEAVDVAASTASKHLGRLEEAGLVEREREWREVHYYPADGLTERVPSAPEPRELEGSTDRTEPGSVAAPA